MLICFDPPTAASLCFFAKSVYEKAKNETIREENRALKGEAERLRREEKSLKEKNESLEQMIKSQAETVAALQNLVAELKQKLNELNDRTNDLGKQMIMPKPESFEDWFSLLFNFLRANATSVQTIVAEAMASMLHVAASQIQMQHHTPLSPATVSAFMRRHATMQASDNQMTSTELMPSQIPSNSQLGAGPLTNASSVQTIVAEAMASMQRVVVASHIQMQHHTSLSPATVSAFMRPHATMQASDNKMTFAELMPSQIPSSNQLGAVSLSPAATSAFVQPPATMQEPFEF